MRYFPDMDKASNKFIVFLVIIATPLAAGAFLLSWQSSNYFFNYSPAKDGFVAPRDISLVIDETQESTVLVSCVQDEANSWIGTGWSINAELLKMPSSKTTIVTNYHLINKCLNGRGEISVAKLFKKEKPAEIFIVDKDNDLAVLTSNIYLPPLALSKFPPWPGYWVMALGSAASFEGSVAFGSVLNVTDEEVLITNNISQGNSGGPLVDNEGKVIGIVTWSSKKRSEQFNGARILDVFCSKLLKCQFEFDDEATWFDYNE